VPCLSDDSGGRICAHEWVGTRDNRGTVIGEHFAKDRAHERVPDANRSLWLNWLQCVAAPIWWSWPMRSTTDWSMNGHCLRSRRAEMYLQHFGLRQPL
jgi:hypothetical protein